MGVNMAGYAIVNDEACCEASKQEIIRRYFATACSVKKGLAEPGELKKQEMLLRSLNIDVTMRRAVPAAREKAAQTGAPAAAIELPDGRISRAAPPASWALRARRCSTRSSFWVGSMTRST